MKKLLLILILSPSILIAQDACQTCSEFSKSKEWSKFIDCVSKKLSKMVILMTICVEHHHMDLHLQT